MAATVRAPLKARTLSAGAWTVGGSMASNVIRLLSNLVLTRLLFPEAFGLMVVATMVTVIVAMLSDVGIHQSIVRGARGDDPIFLDTAWVMQIVRGIGMWLAACAVAIGLHFAVGWGWVPAESTYAHPLLPWIIAATAFGAAIGGFGATDGATANRALLVKPIVLLELGTQIVGILLMIGLAWYFRSIWALVVSGLATTLLSTVLSHWIFRIHRNRFRLDGQALKELLGFGKWLALSSAISVFAMNGDRLILGALVGPQTLGIYSVAMNLASVLDQVLQRLFSRVMLPVFGEVARSRPEKVAETFMRLRWRIDPPMLFVAGALFATGPLLVATLYDSRYHDAGQMLQILSLGLVVSRFAMVQQVYLALNEPRYQVALNLVRLITLYIGVPAAYSVFGLTGALVAVALKDLTSLPLIFWFNTRHGLNRFQVEIVWLLFWPLGWLTGYATTWLRWQT